MPSHSSSPVIVGLTGLARSGKTTVAEYLRDEHGFTIVSLADSLKAMAKRIDPVIGIGTNMVEGYDATPIYLSSFLEEDGSFKALTPEDWVKANFPEYRRFLQRLGTEGLRHIDDRFWIEQTHQEVLRLLNHGISRFVIPDVRFPNEAQLIQEMQLDGFIGMLVNVQRPGVTGGVHPSEIHAGTMGETWIINNASSLLHLQEDVEELACHLKGALFA